VDFLQNDPSENRFTFGPRENYCQEWIVIWVVCHFRNNARFSEKETLTRFSEKGNSYTRATALAMDD
jgi:hypothetical protein